MSATNALLDIASSPPEEAYYSRLRDEAVDTFRSPSDWNNHDLLRKLTHTDSALKETLRLHPVLTRLVLREVVDKEGLHLPDGQVLAKGTWIGVNPSGIHRDARFYHNPDRYEPFRFVAKVKHSTTKANGNDGTSSLFETGKPQGLSTVSDTYLAFSYGRHSW